MATHYEVLGVTPQATTDEIRAAYRRQARRHHPDTQPDADPATAEAARRTMAALNSAWEVLGNPSRRHAYDAGLAGQWRPLVTDPGQEAADDGDDFDREDRFAGWDDPDDERSGPRRATDHLVMTPVVLVLAAVALFFFSMLSQWSALRTVSILLLPVAAVGFVAAPLFVMLRGRANDRSP
ncbi:MAG: J domain-containing protein [Actinomycetota bacterium]|nr:J domain-containing protein [Actinomycetota bacterium]